MIVTIKNTKQAWESPDKKLRIYDFDGELQSGEKIHGQTMSDKIAKSVDQVLDLTTRVSNSNKTYYVQVPRDQEQLGHTEASSAPSKSQSVVVGSDQLQRLIEALEALEKVLGKNINRMKSELDDKPPIESRNWEPIRGHIEDDL